LAEVYKIYTFCSSVRGVISALSDLVDYISTENNSSSSLTESVIRDSYIAPLEGLIEKLAMFKELVEHVIDFDKLPDLMINPAHDPKLAELREVISSSIYYGNIVLNVIVYELGAK
jgi:hypothetical protein